MDKEAKAKAKTSQRPHKILKKTVHIWHDSLIEEPTIEAEEEDKEDQLQDDDEQDSAQDNVASGHLIEESGDDGNDGEYMESGEEKLNEDLVDLDNEVSGNDSTSLILSSFQADDCL